MGRSISIRRTFVVLAAMPVLALLALGAGQIDAAHSAPSAPSPTTSWYMSTANATTLYDMGCAHGRADLNRAGTQRSAVVLAFGAVYWSASRGTYMATLYSGADQPLTTVRESVKQYGRGYYICTASDDASSTHVAMGTNNSAGTVTAAAGAYFADRVDEVGSYFATIKQVIAAGANDIESGAGWSTPEAAIAWVDGYDSANNHLMFNYGDAAGCPTDHIPGPTECGSAAQPSWDAEDIWYVSFGAQPSLPVPEVYTSSGSMALQWKYLSLYSYTRHGKAMDVMAVLTQFGACSRAGACSGAGNTPAKGYAQLYDALNSDPRSADTSFFSTDLRWR
jgi:hypothetical protein